MTLLVTFYSSRGIVFAADSAITLAGRSGATRYSKQTKIIHTSKLGLNGGVVGYFGLAEFSGLAMDAWLRHKLDLWPGSYRVVDVADYLRAELENDVPRAIREGNASGFHIGAFEKRGSLTIPVMQHISNIGHLDNNTGRYSQYGHYINSEHFPSHPATGQVLLPGLRDRLREHERKTGMPVWFRNGELAFSAPTWAGLTNAIQEVTTNLQGSGFRVPDSLDKWELLADTLVRTNGHLYRLLMTRGDPTIEGPYLTRSIPWP